MLKVYILVKNLDSDHGTDILRFKDFTLRRFNQGTVEGRHFRKATEDRMFRCQDVQFSDWLYERTYTALPPSRLGVDPIQCGDAPFQSEDVLLALRLFQKGDVAFVAQTFEMPDGELRRQSPYKYFRDLTSSRTYRLSQADIASVDELIELVDRNGRSDWFLIAKRALLRAGAVEFSPYVDEFDRIIDLGIALEAVLMHETSFATRLIKKRTIALLGLTGDAAKAAAKLLGDFYGHRSKLAHGDAIKVNDEDKPAFQLLMDEFEILVRDIVRTALRSIPSDKTARIEALNALARVTDEERVEVLQQSVKQLEDLAFRKAVLDVLASRTSA